MPLRVGTCSWKYPSWAGLVYSQAEGIDYLAEYATRYNTVEVDQWFWAMPDPTTAAQYASVTPPDFRFTIKLPNTLTLTHFYKKRGETTLRPNPQFLSVAHFEEILARLEPLHAKTGMLMLQFEYLNKEKMESQQAFLDALTKFIDTIPRTVPIAIEPRNPRWLDPRYFGFLHEKALSHVFLEGYYMPPIVETWEKCGSLVGDTAVVRLHGPDREGIEKQTGEVWSSIVAPKDESLDRITRMIQAMVDRRISVYLSVNNHFEGSAPLSIERMKALGLTW